MDRVGWLCVALVVAGCAPAASPWTLRADQVDDALALREARIAEDGLAALEAGWLRLLWRNDLAGARDLLASHGSALATLGAAIAAQGSGDATAAVDGWLELLRAGHPALRRLAVAQLADLPEQAPVAERILAALAGVGPTRGALALDLDQLRRSLERRIHGEEPEASTAAVTITGPVAGASFHGSVRAIQAAGGRARETVARNGQLLLHPTRTGVFLVHVPAPMPGSQVLRIDTRASVRAVAVWAGGEQELLMRDATARTEPRVKDTVVELPEGASLALVVLADRPGQTVTVQSAPAEREEALEAPAVVTALVEGWLAERAGDADGARAAADVVASAAPELALADVMRGRAAQMDGSLPRDIATAEARAAFERALARCPALIPARAGLVRALRDAGAVMEARALLEAGRRLQPDVLRWAVTLAELDAEAGWDADAEGALRAALARHPGSCQARGALAELLWERPQAVDALLAEPPGAGACERTRDLPLRAALRRGEARAVPLAQQAHRSEPEDEAPFQSVVKALLIAERPAEARRALAERAARFGPEAGWSFQEAEAAALAGDAGAARDAWRALVGAPGADAELRHRLALLGFGELWSRLAVDGRGVAADFRTLPGEADAAAVWLLDDTISIWWPDGGAAHRTHVVVRLLTEGAVAEFGEVSVPTGAEILEVRTLKADGTVLEPEDIMEKDTVSMPNLEVGDFIEVALVRYEDPDERFAPGRPSEAFLFRSFDGPVRRARYLIAVPDGMELVSSAQGEGIRALTPVQWPGWRVVGWEALHQPQVQREPLALEPAARLPQVRAALSVTWDDVRRAWRGQIGARLVRSRALEEFARGARGAQRAGTLEGTARQRALALFRAVHGTVRTEGGAGFLLDQATHVLARRRGERVMLLRAALEAAGIPSRILLVHPLDREGADPLDVPGLLRYSWPVIAAEVEGGTAWLDPTLENAPFDYLAPTLQGRPAMDVERDGDLEVTTPRWPLDAERRVIRQSLDLHPDGTATGEGDETLSGIAAISYRTYLAPAEPERRREVLQVLLGAAFPGATMRELHIEGLDDPEVPLRLRYGFDARLMGDERSVTFAVAPEGLSRAYLALGERTTPMLFDGHYDVDATVRVTLPRGLRAASLPAPATFEDDFGSYDVRADETPEGFLVRKRWRMPTRIVSPEDYRAFTIAAGRIDRADRVRVPVTALKE